MRIKITPDNQKSESLRKMAEISLKRLDETNKEKYPSNTVTDYYDILHKLMEAISLKEGIKLKGEGAHQQLIDYITEKKHINEQERLFLQDIRDLRNRVSYEGFIINKDYIIRNINKIKGVIDKLVGELQK